jgi:hypothetical protein
LRRQQEVLRSTVVIFTDQASRQHPYNLTAEKRTLSCTFYSISQKRIIPIVFAAGLVLQQANEEPLQKVLSLLEAEAASASTSMPPKLRFYRERDGDVLDQQVDHLQPRV